MKKIFTFVLALATSGSMFAQTQIGNGNLESWENVDGGVEPVNWNSFLTAGGSMTSFAADQMEMAIEARPGSAGTKSALINSRSVIGIVANGNLTLGRINMGSTSPTNANNHNRTVRGDANFSEAFTLKPDSIVFWAKYIPNGHNGNARMKATIHNDNDYIDPENAASAGYVVGTAVLNYASHKVNNVPQWKRYSVPFNYTSTTNIPAYILVTFTTNEAAGGGAGNDKVYIDDIELIYVPKVNFTTTGTTVCAGSTVTFTAPANDYPVTYNWSFPGGSPATSTVANPVVTYATAGTHVATLTTSSATSSATNSTQIAVNAVPNPTFNYAANSYCTNFVNPVPTKQSNGTFTASPAGLVFANASTGEINVGGSTPGTYTITHTTLGSCSSTATSTVVIIAGTEATMSYPSSSICMLGGDVTPTFTGNGTFTATPAVGLNFVSASTGVIDVTGSTAGTYQVMYATQGQCADTVYQSVTLSSTPATGFSYANQSLCINGTNPAPVFVSGASAGAFSSTTGLSINAISGVIDLASSAAGTYTVTNDIAQNGSCPPSTSTYEVTVNAVPTVALDLPLDTLCTTVSIFTLAGGSPAGGTYSGLGINAANPTFLLTQGVLISADRSIVTYTYTDANGCTNAATDTLYINACLSVDDLAFEDVVVYPNPTTGLISINNVKENAVYTVVNMAGQVVATGEVSFNAAKVDLSAVQNGMYILNVEQGNNKQTFRIVKQ